MRFMLIVHIVAAAVGLASGFAALYAAKGATVHRKAGLLFVATMVTMCMAGFLIASVRDVAPAINVPAATLTAYLVLTALATVRPAWAGMRPLLIGGALVALAVAFASLWFGIEAIANGGTRKGMPAFPFLMFGSVSLLGAAGDLRVLRTGALRGTARLARHLWRMCFALFIAALSFFIGQAQVFPKPVRIPALLALPVLAVLVTMLYWLWRVRAKGIVRGTIALGAAEPAASVARASRA